LLFMPFSFHKGVHACCNGDSCVYTRAEFTQPECTCSLSRDNPHGPRADLLKVNAPLKNETQCKNEDIKCKIREFVLTWSRQKFVSSIVAPGITAFDKGGLLAPKSISKSAMVIMSCQLLFIDFLASFCHFFGLPYHFLYTKKHLE
jgi:hypothetical protein